MFSAVSTCSAGFVVFFSWNDLYFIPGNLDSQHLLYEWTEGQNTLFLIIRVNTQVHLSWGCYWLSSLNHKFRILKSCSRGAMIYHKTLFFQYGGQSLMKTHITQETTHLRQKDLFYSAPLVPLTFFLPEAERLSTPLVSWVGGIQEESSSPSSCRTRRPSKVVRCSKELFCTYISSEICCSLNSFILPHLS